MPIFPLPSVPALCRAHVPIFGDAAFRAAPGQVSCFPDAVFRWKPQRAVFFIAINVDVQWRSLRPPSFAPQYLDQFCPPMESEHCVLPLEVFPSPSSFYAPFSAWTCSCLPQPACFCTPRGFPPHQSFGAVCILVSRALPCHLCTP